MIKRFIFCLFCVCLVWSTTASAADPQEDALIPVDRLTVEYARDVKGLPSLADIQKLDVPLGSEVINGQVVYEKYVTGGSATLFTIASLSKGGEKKFRASAILDIGERITRFINDKGLVVVQVQPDPKQLNFTGNQDLRGDSKDLRLIISMGVVSQVRAIASGNRIGKDELRVDNPLHQSIIDASPVNPSPGHSLVRKDLLDAYVFSLNRHPGRHVDIAVSQAQSKEGEIVPQGNIVLDYLISESKPWSVVVQGSNTGTAQTSQWREKFGYTNNQLSNHDDIFTIDYITSSFNGKSAGGGIADHLAALFDAQSQSADISYDAPIPKLQKLRAKVYGSYDAFTASDLGTGSANFIGEQENLAGEIAYNLFQQRDQFVDTYVGAQYSHIRSNLNPFAFPGLTGGTDIAEPYLGVRAESDSDIATTVGSLSFRYGMPFNRNDSTGLYDGPSGLDQLGRPSVNANIPLLQGDISQSFFIEPLIDPKAFEPGRNVTTATSRSMVPTSTLAHEIVLSARGQYSFGQRLIPQEQEAVGGLYSVRGYPESFVAGDTVAIGTAEYRLHIPRLLAVQPNPDKTKLFGSPFRWSPQQPYSRPDWDLITRVFFDAGYAHTYSNGERITEPSDAILFGTGVGLECQFSPDQLPTIDLRVDYGVALRGASDGNQHVSATSQRFSFVFTLLY